MKLHLISLGCVKNLVDSEVMLEKLHDYDITDTLEEADVIIVNTCGFINSAKEESIDTIIEADERRKENSTLIMAGCLSERYQKELQNDLPEVDIFTGVGDYANIDALIKEKRSHFSDSVYLIDKEDRIITGSNYHAYIKLSEGCNQKCSFCAIPNFKGKLQSRSIETIIDEITRLKAKGYHDFSFASQDSSSYLRDQGIKDGLERLIKEVDKIEGITARILYLYPSTTTLKLIKAIHKSRVFENYFDIPIQHISPRVLKIMKRNSSVDKLKKMLFAMQEVPSFVRTSVIVGHPGESEEDFKELQKFIESYRFDRVNIFEYSDEENTSAYNREDKISESLINTRSSLLSKSVKKAHKSRLKESVGKTLLVFLDGLTDDGLFYTTRPLLWAPDVDGDILINESDVEDLTTGKIYRVTVTSLAGDQLLGTLTSE